MPPSRRRVKKHHFQPHHSEKKVSKRSAATILAVLIGLFGAGIGAFASGSNLIWIGAGVVAGIITGYLVGNNIDKAAVRK